jgi:hypothetical protein
VAQLLNTILYVLNVDIIEVSWQLKKTLQFKNSLITVRRAKVLLIFLFPPI